MNSSDKLTVLIVDDDKMVIDDLKQIINWEALGFEIIGTACNTVSALRIFRSSHPQIVITDIIMPGKDGIELIKEIKRTDPETIFLILSSYDEFNYAKSALQLGVADYLLKMEISGSVMEEKMRTIHSLFIEDQKNRRLHQQLELQEYFKSPSTAGTTQIEAIKKFKYNFFIFTFLLPFRSKMYKQLTTMELIKQQIIENLTAQLHLYEYELIFQVDNYIIIGILNNKKFTYSEKLKWMERLDSMFRSNEQKIITFYNGTPITLPQFRKQYLRFKNVIHFQTMFSEEKHINIQTLPLQDKKADVDTIVPEYRSFAELISKTDSEDYLKRMLEKIRSGCLLESSVLLFRHLCRLKGKDIDAEYIKLSSWSLYTAWILNTYREHNGKNGKISVFYSSYVNSALLYIANNYRNSDITIDMISQHIGISSGRLSVLFKKEVGHTVVEYLTDYRIKRAISLLLHSNYKIYEIAAAVGYNSSQYFSQVFFQKTGKKPLDYRKSAIITITIGDGYV